MTIKGRLVIASFVTIAGLMVTVALSFYESQRVGRAIDSLVSRSTPLQIKSIRLQQGIEKLSANLLKLGLSTNDVESRQISEEINGNQKEITKIQEEIGRIRETKFNLNSFQELHNQVGKAVSDRQASIAQFKKSIDEVNTSLRNVEGTLSTLKNTVTTVNKNGQERSTSAINTFSESFAAANLLKDYAIQLGEIRSIVIGVELAKNKSETNRLKFKTKSLIAATQSLQVTDKMQADFPELKDMRAFLASLQADLNSMAALRLEQLEKGSGAGFREIQEKTLSQLDNLTVRFSERINTIEDKAKKSRLELESATSLGSRLTGIIFTMNSIETDAKYLDGKVRLVMLSDTEAALSANAAALNGVENRLLHNISSLQQNLEQIGQKGASKGMQVVATSVRNAAQTIDRIVVTQRNILLSVAMVQKTIEQVKAISGEQGAKSEAQVKASSEEQQVMIASLQETMHRSKYIMLACSLAAILLAVIINARLIFSVTGPLGGLVEAVRRVEENGDFSAQLVSRSNDEVGQTVSAFGRLMTQVNSAIGEANTVMQAVAGGDLTRRITAEYRGDLADLKRNVNSSLDALCATLEVITNNTRDVATAAAQSSTAISKVADLSQSQLNSLIEVSTALQQSSSAITESAGNAETASRYARESTVTVKNGMVSMKRMMEIVSEIQENSKKVGGITEIISQIADQTNLLSLNAAIEAARAGDHGRGFAVVADEVKKLAEKVTISADDITKLVISAVKGADLAAQTARQITDEMLGMAEAAHQSQDMLQQIATAVEEQDVTLSEINRNVQCINTAADSNASAAQEITSAVRNLSGLAAETRLQIEKFRFDV
jgi:methyl-accepting chemotaxis protein